MKITKNFLRFFQTFTYLKCLGFVILLLIPVFVTFIVVKKLDVSRPSMLLTILTVRLLEIAFVIYLLWRAKVFPLVNHWRFRWREFLSISVFAVPIIYALCTVGFNTSIKDENFIHDILQHMSVGFNEELQFRGILFLAVMYAYIQKGGKNFFYKSSVVVASLFALIHSANLLTGGQFIDVLGQIAATFVVTFCFCLFMVITRNIWLAGMLHALNNSTNLTNAFHWVELPESMIEIVLLVIICFILWLLYKPQYEKTFKKILQNC